MSKGASTRDALVAAAAVLLEEGGPAAVTLREVGSRCGVSHNAPYKHFADKDALLEAVAVRALDALTCAMRARVAAAPDDLSAVSAALHAYQDTAVTPSRTRALLYGEWRGDHADLRRQAGAAWAYLVALVAAAQAAGQLPEGDPERLTALLRSVAHGAAGLAAIGHLAADGKGHAKPAELIYDLLRFLSS